MTTAAAAPKLIFQLDGGFGWLVLVNHLGMKK